MIEVGNLVIVTERCPWKEFCGLYGVVLSLNRTLFYTYSRVLSNEMIVYLRDDEFRKP